MTNAASDWLDDAFNQMQIANLAACPACGAAPKYSCDEPDVVGTYAHAQRFPGGMAALLGELQARSG